MNLRVAKKVLADPDRYSHQQRYDAAARLYRRASTFKDGPAGYAALYLKPQRSFHDDDQLDLRFEAFLADVDVDREIDFPPGPVYVPPAEGKPIYRRDGQVQNFNALPFPSKVVWNNKKITQLDGSKSYWNEAVVVEDQKKTWEMGESRVPRKYSAVKYRVRTGGKFQGVKPPRLKWKDYC